MSIINKDVNLNVTLKYPYNDEYDYETSLEVIDIDGERINDIKTGNGFIIEGGTDIKKDVQQQRGIFDARYGSTMMNPDSLNGNYRCDCGLTRGPIYMGDVCESCGTLVGYKGDNIGKFGYKILKDDYFILNPVLYSTLEAFIGAARLDNIINQDVKIDKDGKITYREPKKEEPFAYIGIPEFRLRFDEVMNFYLKKFPKKILYYNHLMQHKHLLFIHSVPIFSALLRPSKLDAGTLKYEKTNDNFAIISSLVNRLNNDKLSINRHPKLKLQLMYDIQIEYNEVYNEIKNMFSGKKGDIRQAAGGRFSFTARCVIKQDPTLKCDEIKLSYYALCILLEQRIINILTKTLTITYAEAYKRLVRAQQPGVRDKIVYDIIDQLIKNEEDPIICVINRNPTINFGGILCVRVVGIEDNYTMSISLLVLKLLAADFDGETL